MSTYCTNLPSQSLLYSLQFSGSWHYNSFQLNLSQVWHQHQQIYFPNSSFSHSLDFLFSSSNIAFLTLPCNLTQWSKVRHIITGKYNISNNSIQAYVLWHFLLTFLCSSFHNPIPNTHGPHWDILLILQFLIPLHSIIYLFIQQMFSLHLLW